MDSDSRHSDGVEDCLTHFNMDSDSRHSDVM
jgi:hypothetical protein